MWKAQENGLSDIQSGSDLLWKWGIDGFKPFNESPENNKHVFETYAIGQQSQCKSLYIYKDEIPL